MTKPKCARPLPSGADAPSRSMSKMNRDTLEMALQQAVQGEVRFDAVSRMLYRTDASIYEMEPLGLVVQIGRAHV